MRSIPAYLKVLGGLCLGMIVIAIWGALRDAPAKKNPFDPRLDEIASIQLHSANITTVLQRNGAAWEVVASSRAFPADLLKIVRLTDSLRDVVVSERISDRQDRLAEYGLDEFMGLQVSLVGKSGKSMGEGVFGKTSPDYSQTYFRYLKQPGVFLASNFDAVPFKGAGSEWRSRMIFAFAEPDVSSITIRAKSFSSTLVRTSSTTAVWMCNGKPADNDAVKRVLSTLVSLQADGFADMPPTLIDAATLTNADVLLAAKGAVTHLRMGTLDAKANLYAVQVEGQPSLYWISRQKGDDLLRKPAELTKK